MKAFEGPVPIQIKNQRKRTRPYVFFVCEGLLEDFALDLCLGTKARLLC